MRRPAFLCSASFCVPNPPSLAEKKRARVVRLVRRASRVERCACLPRKERNRFACLPVLRTSKRNACAHVLLLTVIINCSPSRSGSESTRRDEWSSRRRRPFWDAFCFCPKAGVCTCHFVPKKKKKNARFGSHSFLRTRSANWAATRLGGLLRRRVCSASPQRVPRGSPLGGFCSGFPLLDAYALHVEVTEGFSALPRDLVPFLRCSFYAFAKFVGQMSRRTVFPVFFFGSWCAKVVLLDGERNASVLVGCPSLRRDVPRRSTASTDAPDRARKKHCQAVRRFPRSVFLYATGTRCFWCINKRAQSCRRFKRAHVVSSRSLPRAVRSRGARREAQKVSCDFLRRGGGTSRTQCGLIANLLALER